MNVTIPIDDRVVAEARRITAVRGTSLNQLVRDYLNELTRVDDTGSVIARLETRCAATGLGQHSIRINDQWRICFVWTDQGATEIEIADYH